MLSPRDSPQNERYTQTKSKGWKSLFHAIGKGKKAFRFEQHLQKAFGLVESKLISNYSHLFSLVLIFTPCSIFLSYISLHRSGYNFGMKSQIALVISSGPLSLKG